MFTHPVCAGSTGFLGKTAKLERFASHASESSSPRQPPPRHGVNPALVVCGSADKKPASRSVSTRNIRTSASMLSPPSTTARRPEKPDEVEFRDVSDLTLEPGEIGPITRLVATDWDSEGNLTWSAYVKKILNANCVYDVAIESPLEEAPRIGEKLNNRILLKREDLQSVFSFKLRGAYNRMSSLSPEELAKGVICSSAGNHAQGVALSAKQLGCSAVIAMPEATPKIKVESVRRLGATVQLVGDAYDATQAWALAQVEDTGRVFIPPFDHPDVIAGQGTVGCEILRQCVGDLDHIFVPVGGGGLIAGIAVYIKSLRPEIKIIGVEPAGANAMAQSLASGKRVMLNQVDGFADGVAVKTVGTECFRLCHRLLDGVVLVSTDQICAAIKDVFEDTRSILEPAGATALAGAKAYLTREGLEGTTNVVITSGANMNFDRLRTVSELAELGRQQEAILASTIPEEPGAFKKLVHNLGGVNISEFKYRYSKMVPGARVLYSIKVDSDAQLEELQERLFTENLPTTDLTDNKLLKMHLRHLVGGHAEVENERILSFEFPEKPGALMRFLDAVSPQYDITLFHYRNSGSPKSQVLVGVAVTDAEYEDFKLAVQSLEPFGYSCEVSSDNDALALFVK